MNVQIVRTGVNQNPTGKGRKADQIRPEPEKLARRRAAPAPSRYVMT
jgi:hypothetical protein